MKYLFGFLLLGLIAQAEAKEACDLSSIGLDEASSDIQTYFYTGTCHYRNKDYDLSVENWEQITELKPGNADDEALKVNVLNNLGYMKFFGLGIQQDQATAIAYWHEAILLGHVEAEYHLCHAYADRKQPSYQPEKAFKHCKKAQLLYRKKADADPTIVSDIESYLQQLVDE